MDTRYTPDDEVGEGLRVLVRPNRSLSLRAMMVLFAGIAVFASTIGIGFSLIGAWLVLPFAGLEVVLVGAVLYLLVRHADDHDLIIIRHDSVVVVRRRGGREQREEFQRYWVKVQWQRGRGWYPSRLSLGSHGRFVAIGTDISEEERRDLEVRLSGLLRRT
jgi:uncharacterized membrane protein